ncbi:MAG: hypothetical protein C0518_09400 [Opitutus sp.]|nr:hypothetical protein [Opitutus sp.]
MRPSRLALLFVASLGFAASLFGAEGGFIATLSTAEQQTAGLTRLSAEQQLALNTQIAREVSLARQGGVSGFAGTFSKRRKPAELTASGLDRLTPAEHVTLDQLVAHSLAAAPVPISTVRRMRAEEFEKQNRFETHGEISFVYGWGSGRRSLMGGSVYTEVYDRETGATIGIGLSRYDGKDWWIDDEFAYSPYGLIDDRPMPLGRPLHRPRR